VEHLLGSVFSINAGVGQQIGEALVGVEGGDLRLSDLRVVVGEEVGIGLHKERVVAAVDEVD
jgi:hypothetical protein